MKIRAGLCHAAVLLSAFFLSAPQAVAQRDPGEWVEKCRRWGGDRRKQHCEVREQTIVATGGTISVDGRQNGGISVKGWDRKEILVRAKIQASGESEADARDLAREISIVTAGGTIHAEGPRTFQRYGWSVSFEIFVPRRTDLELETNNGGIDVKHIHGRLNLSATNGGIALSDIGGDVRGQTTNGGLDVNLDGKRWEGEGLNVMTTNGGIDLTLPSDYSANLETRTTNGGMRIDFPVTVQGRIGKQISAKLGDGGATIRLTTTNGGVTVRRG